MYKDKEKEKEVKRNWYQNNKEKVIEKAKEYYQENKDKIKEKAKNNSKEWKANNRDKVLAQKKRYREKNKDKIKAYSKSYNKSYHKNKKSTDLLYSLKCKISKIILKSLQKQGYTKRSRSYEILGCYWEEFKLHLESKFEPWMSWENRGLFNGEKNYGWDIDHIIPLSSATSEEDIIKLNHYTNLQPLCGVVNRFEKKDNIL
jgi:hypothetical protein